MNTKQTQQTGLNLLAQSADDLEIISASVQDAIVKVGEVFYDRDQRCLTLRLSRFRHEGEIAAGNTTKAERVLSGLQIQDVLSLASKNIDRSNADGLMVLLSLDFVQSQDGMGGFLNVMFAGDGVLKLELDCLDVRLMDVAPARTTSKIPDHL